MNSFYGGKQGRTYHIVERYNSVHDMVSAFQQGGAYTKANYGQYVLIDTILENHHYSDQENGLLYRRGFDYNQQQAEKPSRADFTTIDGNDVTQFDQEGYNAAWINWITNPGGGAIYIGQIVGPKGDSPQLSIIQWADMQVALASTVNVGAKDAITIESQPGYNPSSTNSYKYNDDINVAYVNIKDNDGDVTGCKIAFDFPYPVIKISAKDVSPYGSTVSFTDPATGQDDIQTVTASFNQQQQEHHYEGLIKKHKYTGIDAIVDQYNIHTHPFYYDFNIAVPKGKKGQSIDQIKVEQAGGLEFNSTIYPDISNGDSYFTYTKHDYTETAAGAITEHLGRWPYRVINTITQTNKERILLNNIWTSLEATSPYQAEVGDLYYLEDNLYLVCITSGNTENNVIEIQSPQVGDTLIIDSIEFQVIELPVTPIHSLTVDYKAGASQIFNHLRQIDYITISKDRKLYVSYSDDPNQYFITNIGDGIANIDYIYRNRIQDGLLKQNWDQFEARIGDLYQAYTVQIVTVEDQIITGYYYINQNSQDYIEIDGQIVYITRISVQQYENRQEYPQLDGIEEFISQVGIVEREQKIRTPILNTFFVCIQSGTTNSEQQPFVLSGEQDQLGQIFNSNSSSWRLIKLPETNGQNTLPLKQIQISYVSGKNDEPQIIRSIDYVTVDYQGNMYICYSDDPNQYFITNVNIIESISADNNGINISYTNGGRDSFELNQILSIDFNRGKPYFDSELDDWDKDEEGKLIFYKINEETGELPEDKSLFEIEPFENSILKIRFKNGITESFQVKRLQSLNYNNNDFRYSQNIFASYVGGELVPVSQAPINLVVGVLRQGDNVLFLYSDPEARDAIPQNKAVTIPSWTDPVTNTTYENLVWYNFGPLGAQYHIQGHYTYSNLKGDDDPNYPGYNASSTIDLSQGFEQIEGLEDRAGWIVTVQDSSHNLHIYAYDYNGGTYNIGYNASSTFTSHWYEVMSVSESVLRPETSVLISEQNSSHLPSTTDTLRQNGIWFVESYGHDSV